MLSYLKYIFLLYHIMVTFMKFIQTIFYLSLLKYNNLKNNIVKLNQTSINLYTFQYTILQF